MIKPFYSLIPFLVIFISLKTVAQNNQSKLNALIDEGIRALTNEKVDDAIRIFKDASTQFNWSEAVHYDLGIAYERKGDRVNALNCFAVALQKNPKFAVVYLHRAAYLIDSLNEPDRGLEDITMAIKYGNPQDLIYCYCQRAKAYEEKNNWEKAIDNATLTIEKDPFFPEIHSLRGRCRLENNDQTGAIEDFGSELHLSPNSVSGNCGLGSVAMMNKQPYQAINYFTLVLNTRSNFIIARYQRALAYEMRSDYKNALEDMLIITKMVPQEPEGWYDLGGLYYKLGEYTNSIAAFAKAIDIDPNSADSYTQIIIPLARMGRFTEAKSYYKIYTDRKLSTVIEKNHWTFYNVYAKVITEDIINDDFNRALANINIAIKSYNQEVTDKSEYSFGEGSALKGYILEKLGRNTEALSEYHKAIQEPETQPDMVRAIERLERPNRIANNLSITNSNKVNDIIPATENPPKYYAIMIGEDSYEDKNFVPLTKPISQLSALSSILIKRYNFLPENVKFIINTDREQILTQLESICNGLTKDDNLIVYYAGHGYSKTDKNGHTETFWVPAKAKWRVTATYISYNEIIQRINLCDARHVLLIADACSSGAQSRGIGADASKPISTAYNLGSRKMMTSGKGDVPDESLLAYYFLKSLEDNESKYVGVETLFYSFRSDILKSANYGSYPEYISMPNADDKGGDFIFKKN